MTETDRTKRGGYLVDDDRLRVIKDLEMRNPSLNIGLEEAIAKEVAEGKALPTIRFWRNNHSAIIGRSQEAGAELNLTNCGENEVSVVRRPTGGGTVLHHPGNLNYSIYLPESTSDCVKEESVRLSRPVARVIQDLGFEPEVRPNGLFLGDIKIGGTAQSHRWGLLHHGTLLVKEDDIMDSMDLFLRARQDSYSKNKVQLPSKPAKVGSINSLLGRKLELPDLLELLKGRIAGWLKKTPVSGSITEGEWNFARALADEKYSLPGWTFRFHEERNESKKINS